MSPATEARFELGHIGHYTLLEHLGDGAHGSTYLARGDAGGAEVAVKVLAQHLNQGQFRKMAELLGRCIGVEGIVTLYETGRREDGTAFLSMEHHPLGSLASPPRQLKEGEVLKAIADAARAAHRMHEAGLTHDAIRPSNILLAETGACLAEPDFTWAISPGMSLNGRSAPAVLQYVEPARLTGAPAARASDVWALGVTLHVALTGKPVLGHSPAPHGTARVRAQVEEAPIIDPGLPPEYARLVRACLEPDRADRPATAEEVARELEKLAPPAGRHAPVPKPRVHTVDEPGPPRPGGAPAVKSAVLPTALPASSHEVVPLGSIDSTAEPGPLPLTRHDDAPRAGLASTEVEGVICTRGHFNDLETRYCHMCGMSMLEAERAVVHGPRPAVGVLILDDGSAFHLDMDYVIGADPHREEDCRLGRARPLVLQDRDKSIAPVHAAIRLSGWKALVVDHSGNGGTSVSVAAGPPRLLAAGEEVELSSHTTIGAGGRSVTFYSHHQR